MVGAEPYNGRMVTSADELVAKLDPAAQRRGVEPAVLVDRFIADLDCCRAAGPVDACDLESATLRCRATSAPRRL